MFPLIILGIVFILLVLGWLLERRHVSRWLIFLYLGSAAIIAFLFLLGCSCFSPGS
jgi:hypothetical protein